jgi:hypothetical protein
MKQSRAQRKQVKAAVQLESSPIILTEVARSFSFKLNHEKYGGAAHRYESSDYFCSQKSQCTFEDAEAVSRAVFHFCKAEVMESVRETIRQLRDGGIA